MHNSRVCRNCGTEGHKEKDCKGDSMCLSCKAMGHRAGTSKCPVFKRALQGIKLNAKKRKPIEFSSSQSQAYSSQSVIVYSRLYLYIYIVRIVPFYISVNLFYLCYSVDIVCIVPCYTFVNLPYLRFIFVNLFCGVKWINV